VGGPSKKDLRTRGLSYNRKGSKEAVAPDYKDSLEANWPPNNRPKPRENIPGLIWPT
jgi:hypothetical protein